MIKLLYISIVIMLICFIYFGIKFVLVNKEYNHIDYYSVNYNSYTEEELCNDKIFYKKKIIQCIVIMYTLGIFIFLTHKLIKNDFPYNPIQFQTTFNELSKSYNSNLTIKKLKANPIDKELYNINYKFSNYMGMEGEIGRSTNLINKLAISYKLNETTSDQIKDFIVAMNISVRLSNQFLTEEEIEKIFIKLDLYNKTNSLNELKECVYKGVRYSFGRVDNTDILHFIIEKNIQLK